MRQPQQRVGVRRSSSRHVDQQHHPARPGAAAAPVRAGPARPSRRSCSRRVRRASTLAAVPGAGGATDRRSGVRGVERGRTARRSRALLGRVERRRRRGAAAPRPRWPWPAGRRLVRPARRSPPSAVVERGLGDRRRAALVGVAGRGGPLAVEPGREDLVVAARGRRGRRTAWRGRPSRRRRGRRAPTAAAAVEEGRASGPAVTGTPAARSGAGEAASSSSLVAASRSASRVRAHRARSCRPASGRGRAAPGRRPRGTSRTAPSVRGGGLDVEVAGAELVAGARAQSRVSATPGGLSSSVACAAAARRATTCSASASETSGAPGADDLDLARRGRGGRSSGRGSGA